MKKLLSIVLTICLMLTFTPLGVFNLTANALTSGYYTYTVSNNEATITDCDTSISGDITIPDTLDGYPVTSIGNYAFSSCYNLTSITIPDSVTSIGDYAFNNYSSLTSITVDENNTEYCSVDGVLFDKNKTTLIQYPASKTNSEYTIPDGVTNIGDGAFYNCSSLTSIIIPDSVTSIGNSAFASCESLTSITIPDGVRYIHEATFTYCSSLTSITIPDSVTSIGIGAFSNCSSLTSITIPDSVTSISMDAFSCCRNLTSITIPDSVTRIGIYAFTYCSSLTNITIPDSVTSIGEDAFNGCSSLMNVYYTGTEAQKENITIGSSNDPLLYATWYCNSCIGSATHTYSNDCDPYCNVCEELREVPEHVYDNDSDISCNVCGYIKGITYTLSNDEATITDCDTSISGDITIPDTLDGYPVTSIGSNAFYWCDSLTSITIPKGVTSIGSYAFAGCESITSITIPDSVTSIGDGAFCGCYNLTSITIPDGITSISDYAFDGCPSLTSITIPDSVTSIGTRAFGDCSSLKSIKIPDGVTSIGDGAFLRCSNLTSIIIPDDVTSIGENTFFGCSSLTSITIPNNLTSIGTWAFENCSSLTSITIPHSVTSIVDNAFSGCSSLTSITVDENNTKYCSVDGVLFDKNKSTLIRYPEGKTDLEYTIPDGVTSIGKIAFSRCSNLTSITIPHSVTSIVDNAFSGCSSLTSITVDENNTKYCSVDGVLFDKNKSTLIRYPEGKTDLEYTIPYGVTSIGGMAFSGCINLTSITIPSSITSIEDWIIYRSNITTVNYLGNRDDFSKISVGENDILPLNYIIPISYNGKEENVQWDEENKPILPKGYTDEQNKHFAIIGWTDKDGNKVDTSTLTVDNMIPLTAVVAEIPVAPTMLEADLIPTNDPYLPTGNKYINGFYVQGTQIRVPSSDDGIVMGLRFVNVLDNNLLSALKEGATNVSYGTLVMLKKYHDGTDVTLDTQNVTKVSGENTFKRASEFNNQYLKYTVAITGITEEYFTEKFIVRPYITFTYNGEVVTLYGEQYEGASLYSAAKLAVAPDSIEIQSVQDWIQENIVNVVEKIGDNDVPSDDVFA